MDGADAFEPDEIEGRYVFKHDTVETIGILLLSQMKKIIYWWL